MSIVGKAEFLPNEFIGSEVKDRNGEVCAGLKIVTDLTGLSYDSNNGIVKLDAYPGEDLLYLQKTERVVTIRKSGFAPLQIILNEYGIRLESGRVWQIKVTGDQKTSDSFPVVILTTPDGTEKIINGDRKGTGTAFQLPEGKHTLRIEKNGYKTIEETIEVSSSQLVFSFTMEMISQQIVEIRSVPKEVQIFIDGMPEGVTDNQIFRFPGTYKIRLTKPGYFDLEEELTVTENGENKFAYNLIKSSGTLNLTVTPADAEIEINGKSYGIQRSIDISPGTHSLVVKRRNFREHRETLNISIGGSLNKTINLEAITGNLQVRVNPIDAKVTLKQDGRIIDNWTGAKIINNLTVGNYTLEAALSGYETTTKQITVTEDKTTIEEITLKQVTKVVQPPSSITSGACGAPITYAGKTYNTVKIGRQCWLTENLDYNTNSGSWCYDDKEENCDKYGSLYNWETAKRVCPPGWRLPTKSDFEKLKSAVNNNSNALKSVGEGSGNGAGTNTSGFSALLAGSRNYTGYVYRLGNGAYFWSSTEYGAADASGLYLGNSGSNVGLNVLNKSGGFSVRCLQD